VARRINRIDVWKEAAQAVGGIATPQRHAQQHIDGRYGLDGGRSGRLRPQLRDST
jgi:hypothetical protein